MDAEQQRALGEGLQAGRADAWREFYDCFAEPLWRLVARLIGPSAADVADAVQETFLAAARSAPHYDPARGSPWSWLVGIARNQVALHYRRLGRRQRALQPHADAVFAGAEVLDWLEGGDPPPPQRLATEEVSAKVRGALARLPGDYGALLSARYCDGSTVEQIAAREDRSTEAVRSRLARARRAFRRAFSREFAVLCEDHETMP